MSIYSTVESGTKHYTSRFHKSISFSKKFDTDYARAIPVLAKFVLPGDVWRIGGECLVRFQPMVSPSLTPSYMKVRYFFVPLRLIEPNAELIITGSKDGHLYNGTLPEFNNLFAEANKTDHPNCYKITKYTFYDYLGCQLGDYESYKTDKCLPASYWLKGFERINYDYYDDENIGSIHTSYSDFDSFWNSIKTLGADISPFNVAVPKDYFTSSLPWQLKGTAPVLNVTGSANIQFTPQYTFGNPEDTRNVLTGGGIYNDLLYLINGTNSEKALTPNGSTSPGGFKPPFAYESSSDDPDVQDAQFQEFTNRFTKMLQQQQNLSTQITGLGFNADELRTMMAQTRIFERLARTGSRYTEYLRANFGTAPADDTLQRAQYLGGWKLPIVTTEVLQTAADGSNPVGTMRGHGITRGGNRINTFFAKEFGLLFGLVHFMPQIEYTQGCPKEFSYKSRFDFFNPSLQHLSEQEVRNGELFIGSDGHNDDTFGFQAYGNELRTSNNMTVGDLRDSLKYWTQSIDFGSTRPNLNNAFISGSSYRANFNQCFAVSSNTARPIICQFYNDLDVYRPMVKYSTPGLVDHL